MRVASQTRKSATTLINSHSRLTEVLLTIVVCNLLTPSLRHESCRVDSPIQLTYDSRMQHKKVVKILKLVLKSCDFHTFLMKK